MLGADQIAARNRWGLYCVPMELRAKLPARQVLRGGIWQPETLDLLRRLARQGDVVHAGASFGPFLPGVSEALADGCLLWALEPHPAVFKAAEATAKLNKLETIELHDVSIADRDALGYLPDATATRPGTEMLASQVRLDALIPPRRPVSVIHLAFTEGVMPALEGARRLIASRRPLLIVEKSLPGDWLSRHICTGYEGVGAIGRNQVYRCV